MSIVKKKGFSLILIIVLSVASAFLATLNTYGLAGDAWIEGSSCSSVNNYLSFKNAADMISVPFKDDKGGSKFLTDPNLDKYCINKDYVSSLVDYEYQKNDLYGFCPITSEGVKYVAGIKGGKDKVEYFTIGGFVSCCPVDKPYVFTYKTSYNVIPYCCASNVSPDNKQFGSQLCANEESGIPHISSENAALGSSAANPIDGATGPVFPDAEPIYACPPSACFLVGRQEVPKNEKRTNLSESDIALHSCHSSIGLLEEVPAEKILSGDKVCFEGSLMDLEEYEKWGPLIGLYNSCLDLTSEAEQKICTDCYAPCAGYSSCPLIYNSLGCVDTNPQGLITRVFQIGIGIIGGVGMVRVMQAAFMRQSGDPAKIKESYDIISSVVIGAILLIFGVIILRYIGINVLQILPFDFLQ